jgi:signal peptidase II
MKEENLPSSFMKRTNVLILIISLGIILLVDWASKLATVTNLPYMNTYISYPYGGVGVFKDFLGIEFSLVYTKNTGAAWGLFQEYQIALLVLRSVFVLGLFIYVFFYNKDRAYDWPFTLILAGAVGNILDYFLYGHVIDMFHFILWGYDYPVFNVADSAIFVGIVWLVLIGIFSKKKVDVK